MNENLPDGSGTGLMVEGPSLYLNRLNASLHESSPVKVPSAYACEV